MIRNVGAFLEKGLFAQCRKRCVKGLFYSSSRNTRDFRELSEAIDQKKHALVREKKQKEGLNS